MFKTYKTIHQRIFPTETHYLQKKKVFRNVYWIKRYTEAKNFLNLIFHGALISKILWVLGSSWVETKIIDYIYHFGKFQSVRTGCWSVIKMDSTLKTRNFRWFWNFSKIIFNDFRSFFLNEALFIRGEFTSLALKNHLLPCFYYISHENKCWI